MEMLAPIIGTVSQLQLKLPTKVNQMCSSLHAILECPIVNTRLATAAT
jgi:hypothetical protein